MAEHIQTTRMQRLPTVFEVCTTFSDEILDVKRFAQVNWWRLLTLGFYLTFGDKLFDGAVETIRFVLKKITTFLFILIVESLLFVIKPVVQGKYSR